jgi:Spy/CpxP family protein refolding chaperone
VKRTLLAAVILLAAATVRAQPAQAIEGKWWKRPAVAKALQLTADQTASLEKIFARSKPKLIDLRADLEKKQFEYEQAMQSDPVDRKAVEAKIEARETARSALQKELAMMELDMKQVLTPEQRERLSRMRESAKQMIRERRRRMRDDAPEEDVPPPQKPSR